mmetsp:Transcript_7651/g.15250  ORF Transcript_7651/g.15250 Transcript_7651/m.15250 type:complete len:111 (+) Transcript_7651:2306-2638(+)
MGRVVTMYKESSFFDIIITGITMIIIFIAWILEEKIVSQPCHMTKLSVVVFSKHKVALPRKLTNRNNDDYCYYYGCIFLANYRRHGNQNGDTVGDGVEDVSRASQLSSSW